MPSDDLPTEELERGLSWWRELRAARLARVPDDGLAPGRYLAIEDRGAWRMVPLSKPLAHIGRSPLADVPLEDPSTSRRHAIVARRGGETRILDDRSRNGVFVNGRRVSGAVLSDGDVILLGRTVAQFLEVVPAHARERAPLSAA